MQEIESWLNSNRVYALGLALFEKYGANEFLKKRLKAGADSYTQKKLVEELQILAKKPILPTIAQQKPALKIATQQTDAIANHQQYLAFLKKRDELVKQIERNMAVLDLSTAENICFETAKQILKLHQKKTEIWSQIDFFQKNGFFEPPAPPQEIPKKKEIQQLYEKVSKATKRLDSPKCKNVSKTKALLERSLKRLEQLKKHV